MANEEAYRKAAPPGVQEYGYYDDPGVRIEIPEEPAVEIVTDGAWLTVRLWVSDEEALTFEEYEAKHGKKHPHWRDPNAPPDPLERIWSDEVALAVQADNVISSLVDGRGIATGQILYLPEVRNPAWNR